MNFLVSGIRSGPVEIDLKPSFASRGYTNVNYIVVPGRDEAQKIIDSGKSIDLMVLGGSPAGEFEAHNPSRITEYSQEVNFSRANPKIPAILLINNLHYAAQKELENQNPRGVICSWSEFSDMSKEQIKEIISRRGVDISR
jgi:hypothetical protein